MELRHLEYFKAVCEELHFTRAAEKLGISQPSLSQQIRLLEYEVGMPLFDRIGKKTALTEAGKLLYRHTLTIFHELAQAQAALRDLRGLERGKLTIGALATVVDHLLPAAVIPFHRQYPAIEMGVLGLPQDEIVQQLLANQLDFGILYLPLAEPEVTAIPLYEEELVLAVPAGHELAQADSCTAASLAAFPLLLPPARDALRQYLEASLRDHGCTLRPLMELSKPESLVELVRQGVGLTILPLPYLEALADPRIRLIPLQAPALRQQVGIAYRTDKYMCAATRVFIDQLVQAANRLQRVAPSIKLQAR